MRTIAALTLMMSLVLAGPTLAQELDESDDDGPGTGGGGGLFFGPSWHFLDLSEFNDDLDALGISEFNGPPWGFSFFLVGDVAFGKNVVRLGGGGRNFSVESHESGRYAALESGYGGLLLGYKRLLSRGFGVVLDAVAGFGRWEYDLYSPAFDGRASGGFLFVEPEFGLELAGDFLGLGVTGSYFFEANDTGKLFSGDAKRDEFGDRDFHHAVLNVYVMLGAFRQGGGF
ncbi:hypothetical protein K8I61_00395 [bacterium]|nr:hypothetical protein [bacterium]